MYKRILLKCSGESIASDNQIISPHGLARIANLICIARSHKIEVGLVIGGGNIIRGGEVKTLGINPSRADHMGIMATVINALALEATLINKGLEVEVVSDFPIGGICDVSNVFKNLQFLAKGKVVIFSTGTGNPHFTTDTAAALRAIEIKAEVLFKATQVDGVYTTDPLNCEKAKRYEILSFKTAMYQELGVMDAAAFALCREHNLELRVFAIDNEIGFNDHLVNATPLGTLLSNGEEDRIKS